LNVALCVLRVMLKQGHNPLLPALRIRGRMGHGKQGLLAWVLAGAEGACG